MHWIKTLNPTNLSLVWITKTIVDNRRIDFGALKWQTPVPGARYKAVQQGNRRLRLLEFTKGFIEPDWCTSGHVGYVLEGILRLWIEEERYDLFPGDSIHFMATVKHRLENPGTKAVTALWVLTPPVF